MYLFLFSIFFIGKPLDTSNFNFPSAQTFLREKLWKWHQQIDFSFGVSAFSILTIQINYGNTLHIVYL